MKKITISTPSKRLLSPKKVRRKLNLNPSPRFPTSHTLGVVMIETYDVGKQFQDPFMADLISFSVPKICNLKECVSIDLQEF